MVTPDPNCPPPLHAPGSDEQTGPAVPVCSSSADVCTGHDGGELVEGGGGAMPLAEEWCEMHVACRVQTAK